MGYGLSDSRFAHNGSEAHPASYTMGTAVRFQGAGRGNGQRCEFDHSPASSPEVRNEWNYNPTPQIRLNDVDFVNFTFVFLMTKSSSALSRVWAR
jgi:hypothetical protein